MTVSTVLDMKSRLVTARERQSWRAEREGNRVSWRSTSVTKVRAWTRA